MGHDPSRNRLAVGARVRVIGYYQGLQDNAAPIPATFVFEPLATIKAIYFRGVGVEFDDGDHDIVPSHQLMLV